MTCLCSDCWSGGKLVVKILTIGHEIYLLKPTNSLCSVKFCPMTSPCQESILSGISHSWQSECHRPSLRKVNGSEGRARSVPTLFPFLCGSERISLLTCVEKGGFPFTLLLSALPFLPDYSPTCMAFRQMAAFSSAK